MACGLGVEGSGWVVRPGVVVTNAHVVAGESHTQVQVRGVGPDLAAEIVGFDVHDDIAVLRVPGLSLPPLPLASSAGSGTPVAILGYPLDGAFNVQPGGSARPRPCAPRTPTGRVTWRARSRRCAAASGPGTPAVR